MQFFSWCATGHGTQDDEDIPPVVGAKDIHRGRLDQPGRHVLRLLARKLAHIVCKQWLGARKSLRVFERRPSQARNFSPRVAHVRVKLVRGCP